MGEEYQAGVLGSTWWNSSTSFGWPSDLVDVKPRSGDHESGLVDDGSLVFQDMQMVGINGISSPPSSSTTTTTDWNHSLFGSGRRESNYNSCMQEEDMNFSRVNFSIANGQDSNSSIDDQFNQTNQGFSPILSSTSSNGYHSKLLQTLFEDDMPQPQQSLFDNRFSTTNYEPNSNGFSPSLAKLSPLLRPSMPKQQPLSSLYFWNASTASQNDIRATFFPSSRIFEEKPNCPNLIAKPNTEAIQDSCLVGKKSSTSEPVFKRARIETPSPLPTFKVRKEKLGDRITALQQLVSPFGKTDTASVLQEAIEYIKFLHDQVNVLSTPYIKNAAPIQHQQTGDKLKDTEGHKQDLRSRGLCLVPISSTFPVANETAGDFWTPTFGGTFR